MKFSIKKSVVSNKTLNLILIGFKVFDFISFCLFTCNFLIKLEMKEILHNFNKTWNDEMSMILKNH